MMMSECAQIDKMPTNIDLLTAEFLKILDKLEDKCKYTDVCRLLKRLDLFSNNSMINSGSLVSDELTDSAYVFESRI